MNSACRKQSGVALIVVLLALALMVSLSAVIAENVFVQFQRATQREHYQQAYWYAIGVEALAKKALKQSFKDSNTTNLSQPWAMKNQKYPLDYGQVVGQIDDKQACFNVNVLANKSLTGISNSRPYLVDVLLNLLASQQIERYQAEVITDSIWEYVDSNHQVDSNFGMEDSYYESMSPSYLPPDSRIVDVSELRAVQDMGGEAMKKMSALLCALPEEDWRLDINTISTQQAALLSALFSPYLTLKDALALIESRPYEGWANIDAFLAEPQMVVIDTTTIDKAKGYLDVVSRYYELDALVTVEKARVRIRSLLYSPDRKNIWVVRRRFGGMRERISDRPDQ